MKKISVFGFILVTTAAQLAYADVRTEGICPRGQAQPDCPQAFEGVYLGGNIGYGVAWNNQKFHSPNGNFKANSNLSARGVDGGIGIGYTYRACALALGVAFDANWAGTKGKSNVVFPQFFGQSSQAHTSIRLKNSLQLYGRFGYVIREMALPFIALGWDNSQWKETAGINIGSLFSDRKSKSKRLNGLLWKVGVDFLATRSIVLGFDYTGTIAGHQKITLSQTILGQTARFSGSFKPQYNKFALTAKFIY